MRRLVFLCGFTTMVLAYAAVTSASTLTPVSSTVSLVAVANAEGNVVTNSQSATQGNSENNLFASVDALATGGATSSEATANVFAKFNSFDPDQGTITFSNVGWNITAGPNCNFNCGADLTGGLDFNYTFTDSVAEYFNLNFDVAGFGMINGVSSTFGLNGFSVCFQASCNTYAIGASGTLTFLIVPGPTYSLTIKNLANISDAGPATITEQENGLFLFYTTPTPEPSSLALLGTGMVGVAGLIRRKMGR